MRPGRTSRRTDEAGPGTAASPGGRESPGEGLVELPRADLLRRLLRGLAFDGDAHRHAGADDLEDADLQGRPRPRLRLHVRDPDRGLQGEVPAARLARVPRALLDPEFRA